MNEWQHPQRIGPRAFVVVWGARRAEVTRLGVKSTAQPVDVGPKA